MDSPETQPLVSAMCLTRNRRTMLSTVISAFLSQTYPNRELVILNDLDAESITDLIPPDQRIKEVLLPKLNIGAKRCHALDHCSGEIVIHWDDDEIHSPHRMTDQVTRLINSSKQVTGYHTFKARDLTKEEPREWLYEGQHTYACGSSLCYFRSWALAHPFETLQIGEDNIFSATATRLNQLITSHAEDFLIAGIHPGNTDRKRVECYPWKALP